MKVLIVIPAYNEEKNILKVVETIKEYNKKTKSTYDLIVINDGSSDNTRKNCENNNIPIINLINNLGIGGAVQTGYKYANTKNYDIVVQFDGDGQHDINYIKNIIEPIINNKASMVIGSRFVSKNNNGFKSSALRRFGIRIISHFIKLFTGKKIYDTTSGFRAINKEILNIFANDYPLEYPEPISTVKVLKMGYSICEVPVVMKERKEGKSSIHTWKKIYYMINVILSIIIVGSRRYNK